MTNVNIRVTGTANMSQMTGQFAALQAQVAAANASLAQMVNLSNGVDPRGYDRMTRAARQADGVFRSAVGSTGMFHQQQLLVNSATDDYIEKLNKQKLSFREMMKQRKIATAAYKEQLAMEQMIVRQGAQTTSRGRQMLDVIYPKEVARDMDTASRRVSFFNEQLKSGAHQMVNWGKNTQWAGRQLMVGFTMPLVAAGAAAGVLAYQIDQEFTRIQKVYDTTADANSSSMREQMKVEKELQDLRKAGTETAIMAARNYGAAATDTLNVQAELAATGIKGAELQGATSEVMRIARLGELDYQDALGATISLQTVFRQNTDELTKSFDYMNSIENATSLTTQDFAKAIPIAAAPIKAFGGDVEELGILLTAMKSRGIEATQGANAIKSAMQRLGRPSKQIQEEWTALTGTDITKIFEDSGSLTEIFQNIAEATDGLSRTDKTKAFAGLFGTYQVTRMSAMVEGIKDLETGYGQVGRAAEIAGQSSEEWAKTAQREIDRLNESVSGKFKNALEEVKIQLSTMGEPFIEVATVVLKGVSWIINAFNELPGAVKKVIAFSAGFMALAGPMIMLTGLFANLFGNILKGVATVAGLAGGMKILGKENRAARLAQQLAESGYVSQTKTTQMLTAELHKLTLAQLEANRAMALANAPKSAKLPGHSAMPTNTGMQHGPAMPTTQAGLTNMYYSSRAAKRNSVTGMNNSNANRLAQAQALATAQMARSSAEVATNTGRTSSFLRSGAVSAGVMGGAMAAMMLTSKESESAVSRTVNHVANIALVAAIAAPAVTLLWKGVVLLGKGLQTAAGAAATMALSIRSSAGAAAVAAGATTRGAKASLLMRSALSGGAALLNPWVLAITAIAGGAYLIYQGQKKAREETVKAVDDQIALANSAEEYAESIGAARREWKGIRTTTSSQPTYDKYQEGVKYFEESETGQKTADVFGETEGMPQYDAAIQYYTSLITDFKMSAADATANLAALYSVGAGESAQQSYFLAEQIAGEVGGINDIDWVSTVQNSADNFRNAFMNAAEDIGTTNPLVIDEDKFKELAEDQAGSFAETLRRAMGEAANPQQANDMFEEYAQAAVGGFTRIMNSPTQGLNVQRMMEDNGLKNAQDLQQWASTRSTDEITDAFVDSGMLVEDAATLAKQFTNAKVAADEMFRAYGDGVLGLGEDVNTASEITESFGYKLATLPFKDLRKQVDDTMGQIFATPDEGQDPFGLGYAVKMSNPLMAKLRSGAKLTHDEMRNLYRSMSPEEQAEFKSNIEDIANKGNIKVGADALETLYNVLNNVKNKTKEVRDEAGKMGSSFNVNAQQASDVLRGAMASYQEELADGAREAFDERMEASLDNRQAMWDARADALENDIERRNEALDNRIEKEQEGLENEFERREAALDTKWERKNDAAEKYWDRRVDHINKAIEAEQKAEDRRKAMFEAEIARIDRLNQMMNQNIDFNVALNKGDFDEAAKIRNDVSADAQQTVLQNAMNQGSGASEKRVGRLQGRLENVEESRERFMKNLKKEEDAERKHLQKMKEIRTKAMQNRHEQMKEDLERQSEAQKEALSKRTEDDMNAARQRWEMEKRSLEKQLELFLAYVPRNRRQLAKHMKQLGLDYDDFGGKLKKKGESWSQHFGRSMKHHIRKAGLEMRSDAMWSDLGSDAMKGLLKGMGFNGGMPQFRHFLSTGDMSGYSKSDLPGGRKKGDSYYKDPGDRNGVRSTAPETRHTGGVVGSSEGSRKGVARTQRTLAPSEKMIRAQRGEFVVNKNDAAKNMALLRDINSGKGIRNQTDGPQGPLPGWGGSGGSTPGFAMPMMVAAAASRGIVAGTSKKIIEAHQKKQAELAMVSAFGELAAGKYGGTVFSQEQVDNAEIIASTGKSMGMSERDIIIGLMTAMQESTLRNLDYGDRDSLGLFQQRPSMGWGSAAQVTNPEYASRKFFDTLKGVTNRENMSLSAAAQAVQRSAYPSAYAKWEDEAKAMMNALQASGTAGAVYGNRQYSLPGTAPWVNEAGQYLGNKHKIGTIYGVGSRSGASDHPSGHALDFMTSSFAQGDALASDVVKMHGVLDATYAIWKQRITSPNGGWGNWRPMEDRGSPTANHYDHVHVSFSRTGKAGDLPKVQAPGSAGGFQQGSGGRHRPVNGGTITQGIHGNNGIDLGVPIGSNVYSVADGTVTTSKDLVGNEPRAPHGGAGYYSFGRYIMVDHGAFSTLYAHLSSRAVGVGQKLRGGAVIGKSGNTGYSFGPHLHFEGHGQSPYAFLKEGGTVKWDNTPAILHKDERVLTAPLTKKLDAVVSALYSSVTSGEIKPMSTRERDDRDTVVRIVDSEDERKKRERRREALKYGAFSYPKAATGMADSPYTYFDTNVPNAKNTNLEPAQTGSIRTASLNFDHIYGPQRRKEMERLMERADVMGLSDYKSGGPGGSFTKWIRSKNWGFHNDGGDSPLIWNSAVYKASKMGAVKYANGRGGTSVMNYGLLTGGPQPFWATSMHTAAHTTDKGAAGARARALQIKQYKAITPKIAALKKSAPVLMMGDFNEDVNHERTMYNLLPGMRSNWAGQRFRKDQKHGGTLGGRYVDQIFASDAFRHMGSQLMRIVGLHKNASLAQYQLPQMKTGGTVRYDNTIANLHRDERVLTAPLSSKLDKTLDYLAKKSDSGYTQIVVNASPGMDVNALAEKVGHVMKREDGRKSKTKRVFNA